MAGRRAACHARPMSRDDDLMALARAALEEAGLAGLCRDGRVELALDRLVAAAPDLPRARLVAKVEEAAQAAPP